jgi:hypothetical protein
MAEDTSTPLPTFRQEGPGRDNRPGRSRDGAQRDGGGFRIRLSDNEMQAARALQEAFGLRSTVAVLGFALRTLAQQLEEGKLADLVAQHRSEASSRGPAPQGGERRRERPEGGGARVTRVQRVDPFARPGRPAVAAAPATTEEGAEAGADVAAVLVAPPTEDEVAEGTAPEASEPTTVEVAPADPGEA